MLAIETTAMKLLKLIVFNELELWAKNMNERSICKVPMSLRFLNFSYPIEISSALLVSEMHSKIDEYSV